MNLLKSKIIIVCLIVFSFVLSFCSKKDDPTKTTTPKPLYDTLYPVYSQAIDKWGYKDNSGNVVISYQYQDAHNFFNGRAMVRKDYKIGYIDLNAQLVIPLQFDNANDFSENRATVIRYDPLGYGMIDLEGKFIVDYIYSGMGKFSQGRCKVLSKNGKSGFIDINGVVVIPLEYDEAFTFQYDRARVKKEGKYGFIDINGVVVIPFEYDSASDFTPNGRANVKKNGELFYIDKNGNRI